jgi:AraC-like DNA-binding protein
MAQATVAVSMLRSLLAYLGEQGLDAADLATQVGLDRETLAHPERSVDAAYYEQLMQAGIAALHDPLLGLEFGMAARPDRWGTLGFLLRHCATLGEVLTYQARFAHLVNALGEGRLVARERDVAIEWHSRRAVMPALIEEAFGAWVRFARWASTQTASPRAVEFAHRAQGDPAIYETFFDCPVIFGAPASRLCFDATLLDMPLRTPDAALTAHLSRQVAARQRAADARDIATRLDTWLLDTIGHSPPDLARAAAALNVGERVLQQRLQAQGTSFRRCVDAARHTLALRHLRDSHLSIGDISHRLGFSEQSAFQRAFKRWQGRTPLAWRRS